MKTSRITLIIIITIAFSCNNTSFDENLEYVEAADMVVPITMMEEETAVFRKVSNTGFHETDRKIIKRANLNLQVNDLEKSRAALDKILKKYELNITSDQQTNSNYTKQLSLTIRVRNEALEALVGDIVKIADYVHSKSISAQDVTEEFIDVKIRLKNKKAVEQQYIQLLKRANKIEDILKIENELRLIREEIEAKEGRMRYLESQVAMSTIDLSMYQEIYIVQQAPAKGFFLKIMDGVEFGWGFLKNIIIGVVKIWPVVILLILGTLFLRRKIRNWRLRKA